MRRLDLARDRLRGRALADIAGEIGFADQAHFTRAFQAAFGLTPARYRALAGDYATTAAAPRRRSSGAPSPASHARVDS
jgi:AraC-like DNA-binding protein